MNWNEETDRIPDLDLIAEQKEENKHPKLDPEEEQDLIDLQKFTQREKEDMQNDLSTDLSTSIY